MRSLALVIFLLTRAQSSLPENAGRFPFTKNFGKLLLGISVWEKRVPFVTSPIRSQALLCCFSESPANIKDEKSVNGTQIFHCEVSTGKTGPPFQEFRLFRKISSGTNQIVVAIYIPTGIISGIFGKRSGCLPFPIMHCDMSSGKQHGGR